MLELAFVLSAHIFFQKSKTQRTELSIRIVFIHSLRFETSLAFARFSPVIDVSEISIHLPIVNILYITVRTHLLTTIVLHVLCKSRNSLLYCSKLLLSYHFVYIKVIRDRQEPGLAVSNRLCFNKIDTSSLPNCIKEKIIFLTKSRFHIKSFLSYT